MSRHRALSIVVLPFLLFAAACSGATNPGGPTGHVTFTADVAGTNVTAMELEVTGPGIPGTLVYDLTPDSNGIATGTFDVPSGMSRVFTGRAFDAHGIETHQGMDTTDVLAGQNMALTIVLEPLTGEQPVTLTLATYQITLDRTSVALVPGDTTRLVATVHDARGATVSSNAVVWGSTNPALVSVDSTGLVTAQGTGLAQVIASYLGVAAIATVTVDTATTPPPTASPVGIVFTSNRSGNGDLYIVAPDGSSLTQVTNDTFPDAHPNWAPSASRIVFDRQMSGYYQLFLVSPDGSGVVQLTADSGVDNLMPAFAPDDSTIAYISFNPDYPNGGLAVADTLGSYLTLFGNAPAAENPSWSPDQQLIAVNTPSSSALGFLPAEIDIIPAGGAAATKLQLDSTVDEMDPDWSPDGTSIVYTRNDSVIVSDQFGLSSVALTDGIQPCWSPDGTQIAFVRPTWTTVAGFQTLSDGDIYVMNADGTGITQLTSGPAIDQEPDWGGTPGLLVAPVRAQPRR